MNELLRGHVTRVGFALTLTKGHIGVLVAVSEYGARKVDRSYSNAERDTLHAAGWRSISDWVTPIKGLIARGLVEHTNGRPRRPIWQVYRLTPAGRLVVGLLREAGLYDEVLASIPIFQVVA